MALQGPILDPVWDLICIYISFKRFSLGHPDASHPRAFAALPQRAFCARSCSCALTYIFRRPRRLSGVLFCSTWGARARFRSLRASIFDRFGWYVEFVKIVVSPRRNHYFSCLEPPKSDPKPRCRGIACEFCQNVFPWWLKDARRGAKSVPRTSR